MAGLCGADKERRLRKNDVARYIVSPKAGLIRPALQCPSPNQDDRPDGELLSLVVIHGISLPPGEFGGPHIERFFTNCIDRTEHPYFEEICGLQVSAHLLIRRDGSVIQFVPFVRRAWHAGASSFRGRGRCNDYSIGIELEGEDETPYASEQYRELARVLRSLFAAYPLLNARRIAGHSDIAPGRKTDPGPAFDWMRLYDELSQVGANGAL
jgi:AmpD protein